MYEPNQNPVQVTGDQALHVQSACGHTHTVRSQAASGFKSNLSDIGRAIIPQLHVLWCMGAPAVLPLVGLSASMVHSPYIGYGLPLALGATSVSVTYKSHQKRKITPSLARKALAYGVTALSVIGSMAFHRFQNHSSHDSLQLERYIDDKGTYDVRTQRLCRTKLDKQGNTIPLTDTLLVDTIWYRRNTRKNYYAP